MTQISFPSGCAVIVTPILNGKTLVPETQKAAGTAAL